MQTILNICCSPRGVAAFSRRASNRVIAGLLARHPGARVIQRDLSANPPPLVDAGFSNAILSGGAASPALAVSEALIEELEGADALVIATEWNEFRALDLPRVKAALKFPVMVDLRNIYKPTQMAEAGFNYVSVGR